MTATMKKLLGVAFALMVALSVFALAGCGGGKDLSKSKYTGTWDATTAEYGGMTLEVSSFLDEFTLELKADGSATAKVNGESGDGTWDETGSGIKLSDPKNGDMEFTDVDGKLTVAQDGITIYFEKKE